MTMSVDYSNQFDRKGPEVITLNETQRFGIGTLYVVGSAGALYGMGTIYYNSCWNPKPLASYLALTMLFYGDDPAGRSIKKDLFVFRSTIWPTIYYLGLQAENYKKDVTFAQSVSIGVKGFIVGLLIGNYLYPENRVEDAKNDISFICDPDLFGVSCKF